MIKAIRRILRLSHINFVLVRHGLDKVVLSIPIFAPFKFLSIFNPWNWFEDKEKTRGERIRFALEELGPIFVKFGQSLSTRSDLLPEDIILELSNLQDNVPPFSGKQAKLIIESELGQRIHEVFCEFDEEPLASASIAQVHSARFAEGKKVIVKVLRPNIEKTILQDIDLLRTFAKLAERYWRHGKRLHAVDVVDEFEKTIFYELDLLREAANASQLRRNFSDGKLLYIPEIDWRYTRNRIMVMERIYGVPISDIQTLKTHQVDLKKLAERGVEIFFTQVFRDCFFHADMHPGNIFVDVSNPNDPKYIAVDFGIVGSLSPQDQRYLAENFLAFFNRDYRRVALLHLESGWIPENTRIDDFEGAMRTVCEPMFEKPLKNISIGYMLMRLFQTGRRFHMEVQPQLVLLQKTLLHIEGLGRRLYPELDIWANAKPLLERWLRKQFGPSNFVENFRHKLPYFAETFPEIPRLVVESLESVKHRQTMKTVVNVKSSKRSKWFGFGFGLLVAAVVNSFIFYEHLFNFRDIVMLTFGMGFIAIIVLIIGLFIPKFEGEN